MREFKQYARSETSWLSEVLVNETPVGHEPRVLVTLRGQPKSLLAAKKLLEETGIIRENVAECALLQTKTGMELNIGFYEPETTAQAALSRVHKTTHCNIGAYIHPDTADHDFHRKGGEIGTRFIPGVRISFDSSIAEPTMALVKQYILNQLTEHYNHQYIYGSIGRTGLPLQFEGHWQHNQHETLAQESFYAHFRDRSTNNAAQAKLMSLGICEHLSGVLRIHEVTRAPSMNTGEIPRR